MILKPGTLVCYRRRSARILALEGEKIEIAVEGGETVRVRPKDIEFVHSGPATTLPPPVPKLLPPEELAELMGEETLPFSEFYELLGGENSPGAAWAGVLILQENVYFTGSVAEGVNVRPAAEAAAILAERAAKQAGREERAALVERLRQGCPDRERDRAGLREIEDVACGRATASRLLRDAGVECTAEAAHRLLLRCGIWDEWVNPLPARSGLELEAPELPFPALRPEERWDLTHLDSRAVDDEGNTDPDDALAWEDGILYVHVADVSAAVRPDTELDMTACRRGTTLYLPEKTAPMLPVAAVERLGLGLHEEGPAFTFAVRFDAEGAPELVRFGPSRVRVRRMTYAEADLRLGEAPFAAIEEKMVSWREMRASAGGALLDFPEVKIRVTPGAIEMEPIVRTPARRLVEDAMVAAGSAIGRWAKENDIAMPFVVQPLGDRDLSLRPEDYSAMFRIRLASAPAFLSAFPDPHAGIGVPAYVRVTSPLRRYADLLAHQQLRRFLNKEELLSSDELESRFVWCDPAARERTQLERSVNQYWTLLYLSKQDPARRYRAVFLGSAYDKQTFLLPEIAYYHRARMTSEPQSGAEFEATLTRIDLPTQQAHFHLEEKQS